MPRYARVALFLDYENFYTSLRNRARAANRPFGQAPQVDFERLVAFLAQRLGPIAKSDFVVVANFTHFDPQRGGLNRVATLVPVSSFEHRRERQQVQASPGKKHVVHNFADMRLALEIGRHLTQHPADLYILASGDGAFVAAAHAIREQGREVVFLLADIENSATLIKEEFPFVDFQDARAEISETTPPPLPGGERPPTVPTPDQVEELCEQISLLRQSLRCAIPVALVQALYGPTAADLLKQAFGRGRIDEWFDPAGVRCVSRREERLGGKVHPIPARPEVVARARLLADVAYIAAEAHPPDAAEWRRLLTQRTGLSVKKSKQLLEILFELKILRDGYLARAFLTRATVLAFLQYPDLPVPTPAGAVPA